MNLVAPDGQHMYVERLFGHRCGQQRQVAATNAATTMREEPTQ
jgi:hypothetical protein